jgi:2-hydroxychromene-2-carboxylate isomerase
MPIMWIGCIKRDLGDVANEAYAREVVGELGLTPDMLEVCMVDEGTTQLVQQQQNELAKTGLYGTPTIFIDETAVVGPKPMRVYERLVRGSWF